MTSIHQADTQTCLLQDSGSRPSYLDAKLSWQSEHVQRMACMFCVLDLELEKQMGC